MSIPIVHVEDGIATITLQRPKSLNALTSEDYEFFATALRDIDKRDDVRVTVWQATGKWFCAGTDVKNKATSSSSDAPPVVRSVRRAFLDNVVHTTTDCGNALSSHSKILVAALNGPVMGIAAALLGHFDFIYSMPNAWLSVPFTFLGIASEGGASVSFVNRMGLARANEVLIWGKKKTAEELLQYGFINQIFPSQSAESFNEAVRKHLQQELAGLDETSILVVKKLIQAGLRDKNDPDAVNLRESYAQAERFASGRPSERFGQIARKEIKHKL